MTIQQIKVFIIDDDFYVRQATTTLLTRDRRTKVIGTAGGLEEAFSALNELNPDVILLDLDFKHTDENGLDGIVHLKKTHPRARILVFSASRSEEQIIAAIRAGADGYIWKNDAAEGLGSAIQRANEGRFVVTEAVARSIFGKISGLLPHQTTVMPKGKHYLDLTQRIEQVMKLFCIDGMSAPEIANLLVLSEFTVRGYIRTGYEILGASSRSEAFQRLIARADEE